jgi:hypothetical protein
MPPRAEARFQTPPHFPPAEAAPPYVMDADPKFSEIPCSPLFFPPKIVIFTKTKTAAYFPSGTKDIKICLYPAYSMYHGYGVKKPCRPTKQNVGQVIDRRLSYDNRYIY